MTEMITAAFIALFFLCAGIYLGRSLERGEALPLPLRPKRPKDKPSFPKGRITVRHEDEPDEPPTTADHLKQFQEGP